MPKGATKNAGTTASEYNSVFYPKNNDRPLSLDMTEEWFLTFVMITLVGAIFFVWLIFYLCNYARDHPLPTDRKLFRTQFRTQTERSEAHATMLMKLWRNRIKERDYHKPNVPIPEPELKLRKPARNSRLTSLTSF